MSDLGVSGDLRGPVFKPDLGGGLGAALAGTMEKELPKAIQSDNEANATKQRMAGALISDIDSASQRRKAEPKPTLPTPPPPPQFEATSPVQQWGSMAMGMAMLGSAFTKRPAINALNAAAGVMNAYHDRDQEAYKRNFDHWKATSDYSLKMYEYQREAYRDALSDIDKDVAGAMQKFRVVAEAFKDDHMAQFAKIGNAAAVIQTLKMSDFQYTEAKEKAQALERHGQLLQRAMDAQQRLQRNPNDAAAAQELQSVKELAAVEQQMRTGTNAADQKLQSENDLFTRAKAEKESKLGRPLNTAEEIETRKEVHGGFGGAAGGALHPSAEFEIKDKDGKVVERVLAREGATAGSPPVRTDTGKAIELAPGQTIHKAPPGSEGRQAASQANRLVGATSELTASLRNLVELPISATAGPFMGLQAEKPATLRDAVGRVAASHLIGEEARAVTQQFTGLQRQLATIESQGAAQGLVGLTNANNVLVPQSGWSGTAVLRSYAEIRQIAEANIRAMLSQDIKEPQKELLRNLQREIEEVVPYTVHDVNELAFGNKKKFKESVSAFADKVLQRRKESESAGGDPGGAAGALPAEKPPTAGVAEGSVWRDGPGGKVLGVLRGGKWVAP